MLINFKRGKKAQNFKGTISNGIGKERLIGFSSSHQNCLLNVFLEREPVLLDNCEIKRARRRTNMKVVLKVGLKYPSHLNRSSFLLRSLKKNDQNILKHFFEGVLDTAQYFFVYGILPEIIGKLYKKVDC